jgi:hypothetical protein
MSGPDHADQEFVDPSPESKRRFFVWWLLLMIATFGPLWLLPRIGYFSDDASESVLFWKLAALVGYYSLLGLAIAAFLLRKAWLTWRSRRHPHPGETLIRRTRAVQGTGARLHAVGHALLGLMVVYGIGHAWAEMQIPALFFGIGEYRLDAPAEPPCPEPGS